MFTKRNEETQPSNTMIIQNKDADSELLQTHTQK